MAKSKVGSLSIDFIARTNNIFKGIDKVGKSLKRFESQANKSFKKVKDAAFTLQNAVIALTSALAFKGIFEVNAKFEKLDTTLSVVTGSVKNAEIAMALINKTAKQLPESVEDVATSFIRMQSLGLKPTEKALISFGNTASAMGKGLLQFIEAVADAVTGEFERLKEFGIKAKTEGDKISFRFQGITTSVGNNAQEINDFLRSIGENQFAGAATKQMDTLAGRTSNLKDEFDKLILVIGKAGFNDFAKRALVSLSSIVVAVRDNFAVIEFIGAEFFQSFATGFTGLEFAIKKIFVSIFVSISNFVRQSKQVLNAFGASFDIGPFETVKGHIQAINEEHKRIIENIKSSTDATKESIIQEKILGEAKRKTLEASAPLDKPVKSNIEKVDKAQQAALLNVKKFLAQKVEATAQSLLTEEERLKASLGRRTLQVKEAFQRNIISGKRKNDILLSLEEDYTKKSIALAKKREDKKKALQIGGLRSASGILRSLTTLVGSNSRRQFEAGKKLARASVIIDTAAGIMKVIGQGGFAGIAAAVGIAISGAAQLATINRTSFGGGGGISSGGVNFPSPTVNQQPISQAPGQPNETNPTPVNVTLIIQGNLVGNQEFIDNDLLPAMSKAINQDGQVLIEPTSQNGLELRNAS